MPPRGAGVQLTIMPRVGGLVSDAPALMQEWYDEGKYLDFFVYQSVTCKKSKNLREGYNKRHNSPPDSPVWMVRLQTLIMTAALLLMQIAVPAVLCYRFISQLHDMYADDTRPERDLFNRMAGSAFMFGAMGILSSDCNELGHTYFAQGKWHSIRGRKLRWMALGLLANLFSILATELALLTSFLLTNELLDFVFNFAALFVLYQVDSFLLSSDQQLEITRFVENLEPEDMDSDQDAARFEGPYMAVHHFMLCFFFTQTYVLRFVVPILFAVLY